MQLEASSCGTGFGILAAAAQWIRKRFRNRGKTRLDLEAEKEAAKINRTCGALEEMLFEYFLHAREGSVDPEALGELTGVLREVTEYSRAGKLPVPGEKDLEAMCAAAAGITAALSGGKPLPLRRRLKAPTRFPGCRISCSCRVSCSPEPPRTDRIHKKQAV